MRGGGAARPFVLLSGACLLGVMLSGCVVGVDDGLPAIFGDERVWGDPNDRMLRDVLEARVVEDNATGGWTRTLMLSGQAPPLVLTKEHPGPQGGGGETLDLPLLEVPPIEVRFDVADRLGNFSAHWSVEGLDLDTVAQDATEPFLVALDRPGRYAIEVALLRDGEEVARTYEGLPVVVDGTWVVESSVYPLRVEGTPTPPNYDEMRDVFRIDIPTNGMTIDLTTLFRGSYDPAQDGTDVDLGLFDPSDAFIQCIGSGGGGSATPVPDPAAAKEEILAESHAGIHTIHVGSLREDCAGSTWYHNQGPVPYRLMVSVVHAGRTGVVS